MIELTRRSILAGTAAVVGSAGVEGPAGAAPGVRSGAGVLALGVRTSAGAVAGPVAGAAGVSSIGVERSFMLHSPRIDRIEVLRHGSVRRAKLYYLRDKVGRAARIKEDRNRKKP